MSEGRIAMDHLMHRVQGTRRDFEFSGRSLPASEVIRRLTPFLTPGRIERIADVIGRRTYSVATVVEGLANAGNVSAVMRTAEAFGFQRFDMVAGDLEYKNSRRTTQGAEKWIDVHAWKSAAACVDALHADGYRVVVTDLSAGSVSIETLDFTERTAVVFGNELEGVSAEMRALADVRSFVPISGFVESFNISVAAAVVLYHIHSDRKRRTGRQGDLVQEDLAPDEIERLTADFYLRALRSGEDILTKSIREEANP